MALSPTSSHGGSSSVTTTKIVLTDAQIRALPTTTVELLPAPGAGKMYAVLAHLVGPFTGTAYTNINAEAQFYGYSGDDATIQNNFAAATVLTQPNIVYAPGPLGTNTALNAADDTNQPLHLGIDNAGSGDLTGGDAANTLPVTVVYALIDV